MARDTLQLEPIPNSSRVRGCVVLGCASLLRIAAEPVFHGGCCNDCHARVVADLVIHRADCPWLAAFDHVLRHRCAPAHVRALVRGWAVLRGGK